MSLALLLLPGCFLFSAPEDSGDAPDTDRDSGGADTDTDSAAAVDADGDGVVAADDCDDHDGDVRPGVPEVCDGIDNDCNALTDDDDPFVTGTTTWYADADGDGAGAASAPVEACLAPVGTVANATDCDDDDAAIAPGAEEVCGDGLDNDCDVATVCGLPPSLSLEDDSSADAIIDAEEPGDGIGGRYSTGSVGDVNGDGKADLGFGCYSKSDYAGRTYVFYGPVSGVQTADRADVVIEGDVDHDYFGWAVIGLDADADGRDDLVVSGKGDDGTYTDAGSIRVFTSLSYTMEATESWASIDGSATDRTFGNDIYARDLDGDGAASLIVATYDATYPVRVYDAPFSAGTHSEDTARLTITEGGTGTELAFGDLDGDGVDEIVDSDPADGLAGDYSGTFWIVDSDLSGTWGAEAVAETVILGDPNFRSSMGNPVVADFDGDGNGDLLATATAVSHGGLDRAGGVFVMYGPLHDSALLDADLQLYGDYEGSTYGAGSRLVGDLDGDGGEELAIGELGTYNSAGWVHLYSVPLRGVADRDDANVVVTGFPESSLGDTLPRVGDTDGDGVDDLFLGTNGYNDGDGRLWLILGGAP